MELDMFHSQEFFAAYIKLHALLLLFVLLSYIFRCAGDLRIKSPKYCAILVKEQQAVWQMGLRQSLRWQV